MAQKKLLYDITTKVKEVSNSYYDDTYDTLVLNNVTFNSASLSMPNGIAFVSASKISSSDTNIDGQYVSWDNISQKWIVTKGASIDVSSTKKYAPLGSDLLGTLDNPKVISLKNINSGPPLPVNRGGTGLSASQYPTGENLLLGNGTDPLKFFSASSDITKKNVLLSNGDSWGYFEDTPSQNDVEVEVFLTPGTYTWNRPVGTKSIRVLAQGAGGGGGSGANRNSAVAALGGAGGSAGCFINSGIINIDESFTAIPITVGSGGLGASYPVTNSAGFAGSNGQNSSFGTYIIASGGLGGNGGNINSSVTSSGGTSVSGFLNLYSAFTYNTNTAINTSRSGSNNSTTSGINWKFSSLDTYYNAPGGASGGSLLSLNYTTSYSGGVGSYDVIATDFEVDLNNNILEINNMPVTSTGDAALSTVIKKNGTRSGYFSGNSVYTGFSIQKPALGTNFTGEAWIYPTAYVPYGIIFDLRGNMLFYLSSNGQIVFSVNSGTNFSSFSTANGVAPLNTWTHVAFVKNSSGAFIYVNGVLAASNSSWATYSDANTTLWIGYTGYFPYSDPPTRAFRGYMDRVRLYPYARYSSTFVPEEDLYKSLPISVTSSILPDVTFPEDIFLAPGGNGGASSNISQNFNTFLLANANLSNPTLDESLFNNTILTGTMKVISSASVPGLLPLSGTFSDGIVSSSGIPAGGGGYSFAISPGFTISGSSFYAESWFYLYNTGSAYTTSTAQAKCYLMSIGRTNASLGVSLGISQSGEFKIYYDTFARGLTAADATPYLNKWVHIAFSCNLDNRLRLYVNGVPIVNTSFVLTNNPAGEISYGSFANNSQLNFNGFAKGLMVLNIPPSDTQILNYYNHCIAGVSGSRASTDGYLLEYPGKIGGNATYGAGGGGGGASTSVTGSLVGIRQGGNGGDGYVAVISYKY